LLQLWLNHVYLLHSQCSPGPRLRVAGNEYWRGNGAPIGGADYQLGHTILVLRKESHLLIVYN